MISELQAAHEIQAIVDAAKPLDIVALVQTTFAGLAVLVSAVSIAYLNIVASRVKAVAAHVEKVDEVAKLIERNTNSMTTRIERLAEAKGVVIGEAKGVAAGEEKAATLAEGQRQGREATGNPLAATQEAPVPVVDDKVAKAIEKSATATEHVAAAAKDK